MRLRAAPPQHRPSGKRRVLAFCVIAVCGALALAACSSGGDSPSAPAAVSASKLSSLRAVINQAEQAPAWTAPGPKVSARAVRGKSLLVMPVSGQIDACNTQAGDLQALGQRLGLRVTVVPGVVGLPTQWAAGIDEAVADHDNALVMLCGVPNVAVGPELAAAHRAGVKVVDGNDNEVTNFAGIDGETGVNTVQGMQEDVDDAILQLDGKPLHALLVTSDSVLQGPPAAAAAVSQVNSVCPKICSVVSLTEPIQDWTTSEQSQVYAELVKHPDINAVIVVFDGMVLTAERAVQQVRRPGLEIYTWGGSRTVEDFMLQKGSLVAADVGPDQNWDAYESMDQVIRLLGGHPAASINSEVAPNRFWTPDNVSQFFGPAGSYGNEGYGGNDFINGFDQLWGLAP